MSVRGLLKIKVVSAVDIPPMDMSGQADPYVVLSIGTKTQRTQPIRRTLAPRWDKQVAFTIHDFEMTYKVLISVYDEDRVTKDDFIGRTEFLISDFIGRQGTEQLHLELTNPDAKRKRNAGTLTLEVSFVEREELFRSFCTKIARVFDANGDGMINLVEFRALMDVIDQDTSDEEVEELYRALDVNGTDGVDVQELYGMLLRNGKMLNDSTVQQICESMEANPDVEDEFVMKGFFMQTASSKQWATSLMMLGGRSIATQDVALSATGNLLVISRETGVLEEEKIPPYIKLAFRAMYKSFAGQKAATTTKIQNLLRNMTHNMGQKYSDPKSVAHIQPFIRYHNVNVDEILEPITSFRNFNEFFYRKLIPGARPIKDPHNSRVAVCPADCRLNVYPRLDEATRLWIKGRSFSLESLLNSAVLAEAFENCGIAICRLAPQDYHRFHSPVSGLVTGIRHIDGAYYTVNPVAVRSTLDVFTENKRSIISIDTTDFGPVLFVAIGATCVGSIEFTVVPGQPISKGDELGFFAFGGSTVLVLYQANAIEFASDLKNNSRKPLETLVRMGSLLGSVPGANAYAPAASALMSGGGGGGGGMLSYSVSTSVLPSASATASTSAAAAASMSPPRSSQSVIASLSAPSLIADSGYDDSGHYHHYYYNSLESANGSSSSSNVSGFQQQSSVELRRPTGDVEDSNCGSSGLEDDYILL